ncbi:MAG: ribosome small subunit-dependent GTPase A [Acidobacteriota bacterium]
MELANLGWDAHWASLFAEHEEAGLVPARVTIVFNHIYRVRTASDELRVQQAGRLLHRAAGRHELAAVGDWVGVRQRVGERTGTIEVVLPRRSAFSRKVAGETTEQQVVAANIDMVFLVMGLDGDYNPRRVERYLLMAYESGASPVVLLSKADLAADVEGAVAEISGVAPGTPVHPIIAVPRRAPDGSLIPPEVDVVRQYLGPGRTGALLGSSGVGKSTIINALTGTDALKTAAVRSHDSRGRHTTRHRQLLALPGDGLLIDTPGMRELQLWDVAEGAQDAFDDIETLAASCHFSDCRHGDEPRCGVKAAIESGALPPERLASYVKLQREARALEVRRDVRALIDSKRQAKVVGRAIKQLYRERGRQ